MGLLGKLKGGLAFNTMAKAYKEILDLLGMYNINDDVRYVYKATWILTHCVIGSIEKWHWNVFAKIMIPNYATYGRITVQEMNLIVIGKIAKISQGLSEEEEVIIDRIMDGEKMPYVESLISASLREKLMP